MKKKKFFTFLTLLLTLALVIGVSLPALVQSQEAAQTGTTSETISQETTLPETIVAPESQNQPAEESQVEESAPLASTTPAIVEPESTATTTEETTEEAITDTTNETATTTQNIASSTPQVEGVNDEANIETATSTLEVATTTEAIADDLDPTEDLTHAESTPETDEAASRDTLENNILFVDRVVHKTFTFSVSSMHSCSIEPFVVNISDTQTGYTNLILTKDLGDTYELEIGSLPSGIDVRFTDNNGYIIRPEDEDLVFELKVVALPASQEGSFNVPIIFTKKNGGDSSAICQFNIVNQ